MVLYALTLVMLVYAAVDLTRTPGTQVRTLSKPVWYVVLLVLPLIGAIAWLLLGRPKRQDATRTALPPVRPVAPDDDEDFLRELRRRGSDPRDDAA